MRIPRTHTHTYAILEVSSEVYEEIRRKLVAAGYEADAVLRDGSQEVIDMHGIALQEEKPA